MTDVEALRERLNGAAIARFLAVADEIHQRGTAEVAAMNDEPDEHRRNQHASRASTYARAEHLIRQAAEESQVTDETLTNAGADHYGQPMTMPMGMDCAVHRHQEYVPIESHHRWPIGLGGPDVAGNRVKVCANGHYATHEFLRQLMLHNGAVPWPIAQHYGQKVRDLATRGWVEAGRPVHGGGGE